MNILINLMRYEHISPNYYMEIINDNDQETLQT